MIILQKNQNWLNMPIRRVMAWAGMKLGFGKLKVTAGNTWHA
jgi:hypothetical protein